MKKISNFANEELRAEQFRVFMDVLKIIKNASHLELFLRSFLTKSEAAYLGQRLNIMRMLAKGFTYQQITEKLGVPSATISKAKSCLEDGGELLKKIVLEYKYKKPKLQPDFNIQEKSNLANPSIPGAIKL